MSKLEKKEEYESEPSVESARAANAIHKVYPLEYREKLQLIKIVQVGWQDFYEVYKDGFSGFFWRTHINFRHGCPDGFLCLGKKEDCLESLLEEITNRILGEVGGK